MATEVDAFIAAELERLRAEGRQVDLPVEPFGFGVDLVCRDDITPDAAELDPNSPEGIGQDLYHRAITERGFLVDDKDYGFGVQRLLHQGMRQRDLAMAAAELNGEFRKDDRVGDVTTTITPSGTKALRIRSIVTPADPEVVPFEMILAVTDGQSLLEVTATG